MHGLRLKTTLLTGLLTIIPLWVTWLVFKFIVGLLARLGTPLVTAILQAISLTSPTLATRLNSQWLVYILATLMTLVGLYLIGLLARLVVGQRILHALESLVKRIPFIRTIYDATKQLLTVLQSKPEHVQRVVLVEYPRRGIKAVGMVTRVMREERSGREVAAVFIPTTPNPTSGYLEVVPVEELTPTDWTIDQAMAFVISGGAVAPDTLPDLVSGDISKPD